MKTPFLIPSLQSFGCMGAMLMLFQIPGCDDPLKRVAKIEIGLLGPDEFEPGENGNVAADPGDPFSDKIYFSAFVVNTIVYTHPDRDPFTDAEIELTGFDGRAPAGFTNVTPPYFTGYLEVPNQSDRVALFLIDESAPLRPFYVSVKGATKSGLTARSNSVVYYLHKKGGPPAPRIAQLSLTDVEQRTQPVVTITGINFTDGEVLVDDPFVTVLNTTVINASAVEATLDIPADAGLGFLGLRVRTPAGSSTVESLFVRARPVPQLTGLFPNYGSAGGEFELTAVGDGFTVGTMVHSGATALEVGTPVRIPDPLNLTVPLEVVANAASVVPVTVESIGGETDPLDFNVSAPGFQGPRITRVRPEEVVEGSMAQIFIEGENMGAGSGAAVQILTTRDTPDPLLSQTLIPATTGGSAGAVNLGVATETDTNLPHVFRVAIQTADGLTTQAVPILILPRPTDLGTPFVRKATLGHIARGTVAQPTVQPEIILGEHLFGATGIEFDQPGLSATITGRATDGTSLAIALTATSQAPLTGNARTTFTVRSSRNRHSNEAAYIVTPSGLPPGPPQITGFFPNFVYPDPNTVTFDVTGANLQNPTALQVAPAGAITDEFVAELQPGQAKPGTQLFASFKVPAAVPGNTFNLTVTTQGGTLSTNTVPIAVLDPANPTGPEILTVSGLVPGLQGVYSGSVVQFQIFGTHFGPTGPTSFIHFAPLYDDPIGNVRLFTPSSSQAAQSSVVVQLDLAPIVEQGFAYTGAFALNVNGLVTRALLINLAPPPTDGPFVFRTEIGEIVRGGAAVNETIYGVGLNNVTGVFFTANQAGITVSNIVQSTDGGASFKATFTASPTAALTGDSLTRFQVITTGNIRSEEAAYIVKP